MHSEEPTAPHPFEVIKYHVDTHDPTPFTIPSSCHNFSHQSIQNALPLLSSNATDPKFQDVDITPTATIFWLEPITQGSSL